jgi:crotonobetaine/carnitine-CoA ligase
MQVDTWSSIMSDLTPLQVLRAYPPHGYTLPGALASRAHVAGGRDFLVCAGRALTWAEAPSRVAAVAARLRSLGVGEADRVCVMARNSDRYALVFLALARLGAVMVPVNPEFGTEEAGYVFQHCGAAVILCEDETVAVAREASAQQGLVPAILLLDAVSMPVVGAFEADDVAAEGTPDSICVIVYTSGTSGFPKGVMHSHRTCLLAGEMFVKRMRLQPDDRLLVVLPMFHVNALLYSLCGTLAAGATAILAPRFSASRFWELAVETRATEVNVIEAMGNILASRSRDEYDSRHRIVKAYGVRPAAAKVFREEFGIEHLMSGYGMTEIPGAVSPTFEGPNKPGSIGVPGEYPDPALPAVQCRLVDDEGRDVAVDAVGELAVRMPGVMRGYFNDEQQTAEAFRDGWFFTGDLMRRDADGHFFFVSRKKDIIRKKGNNIAGAELDRVIGQHPGVHEAAAIAVPSELGEDEILVMVAAKEGATLSAEDIVAWCSERLEPIKVPRYVVLASELPHTPTHKVAKNVIRSDKTLMTRAFDRLARAAAQA